MQATQSDYDRLLESKAGIESSLQSSVAIDIGIILGSGLGDWADSLDNKKSLKFGDIKHMPSVAVEGHKGALVFGEKHGVRIGALQGRIHMYEGHSAREAGYPARLLAHLGAKILIVTNASGGLRADWPAGTLMLIADHIDTLRDHPLRGMNDSRLGPRFPDMSFAYPTHLRELAKNAGKRVGVALQEGVYVAVPGPCYETPSEVRMLRGLGADAVGMSTVPEVIVANHMGRSVLGISCITNPGAGISPTRLNHEEVTQNAQAAKAKFGMLLDAVVQDIATQNVLNSPNPQ